MKHRTSNPARQVPTGARGAPVFLAFAVFVILAISCQPTFTLDERLAQYGPAARIRIKPDFEKAQVPYPPQTLVLAAFKKERVFEVYALDQTHQWRLVSTYPILGASGVLGPKLREGDLQVPEGIYPITELNPNSTHQVSLRIGYPNGFDRAQAALDGRTNLGGDIMIHGGRASIGCIAVGDQVSEDLFVLAADTGVSNITVVISPVDFREGRTLPASTNQPAWIPTLYNKIKATLVELPEGK